MSGNADFSIEAPAKTNLTLRVLGRREDGFHEIETRMCRLSIFDRLSFTHRKAGTGVKLTCDDPSLPTGEANLAVKAVRAMEQHCHRGFDVAIDLRKKIPSGAGLGGGSSNAAAVLKALNHLHDLKLPADQLALVGARVGSDVPFFCYDSAAICRGRGEAVEPFDFDWKLPMLVVQPPFEISAARAYQNWEGASEVPGVCYVPQLGPWGELVNDLERPVFEKYLVLARIKNWLLDQGGVDAALLSGSGSCMIAVLARNDSGERLAARIQEAFGKMFHTHVCHTLAS